jgi:hypothetical protein
LLNAQAVARALRRSTELEPDSRPVARRRVASRGKVLAMLVIFNLAWIATVALWYASTTDEAQELVEASV